MLLRFISFPLPGGVPIVLQNMMTVLNGLLLGPWAGTAATALFVAVGVAVSVLLSVGMLMSVLMLLFMMAVTAAASQFEMRLVIVILFVLPVMMVRMVTGTFLGIVIRMVTVMAAVFFVIAVPMAAAGFGFLRLLLMMMEAVFLFFYLRARKSPMAPDAQLLRDLRIDLPLLGTILRLGIPAGGDFAVWDLDTDYDIDPSTFYSMGQSTPFEGWTVLGRCLMTVHNGKVIYVSEEN